MTSQHEKNFFDQIWHQKALSDELNSGYIPGKNLRIDYCIRNLPKGENFLDIGCGTGILANEVKGIYYYLMIVMFETFYLIIKNYLFSATFFIIIMNEKDWIFMKI